MNDMRLGDLDALEQFFLHESKRLREFMNSEGCDQEERKYINTFLPTVEWARKTVHGISTIDAVPVVRCKDCKYSFVLGESDLQKESPYKYYRKDVLMCGCEEHFGDYPESVDAMFFCGYGERKDGDGK